MRILTIVSLLICIQFALIASPPSNLEVKLRYEVSSSNFNPMNPMAGIDETGDAKVSLIIALADEDIESIEVTLKRSCNGRNFNFKII